MNVEYLFFTMDTVSVRLMKMNSFEVSPDYIFISNMYYQLYRPLVIGSLKRTKFFMKQETTSLPPPPDFHLLSLTMITFVNISFLILHA